MKRIIAAFMSLAALALSGCSHTTIFSAYREIEDVEIVNTIGVDKTGEDVKVTASSGIGKQDQEPHLFDASDKTMASALQRLEKLPGGKETVFSHTERILISEEAAKSGIYEFLDHVERTNNMRLDTYLYIIRGGEGELMSGAASKKSSASDMMRHLEKYGKRIGNFHAFTCEDVAAALALRGSALVMAVEGQKQEKYSEDDSELMVVPAGLAILKDGKLEGYLSDEESFGAMLLMNLALSDTVELFPDEAAVTVEMTGVSTKYTPVFENGELVRADAEIKVQANIISLSGETSIVDEKFNKALARKLADVEFKRAAAAIERSKRENIDFMALGSELEREKPVKFAKMKNSWEDIFPTLPFHISVSAEIRRTYDIGDPLSVKGEKETSLWERLTK